MDSYEIPITLSEFMSTRGAPDAPAYAPDVVTLDYNPDTDWGTTDRGDTLNTMWNTVEGFVILELSDTYTTYVLPVRRDDTTDAKERAVRARLRMHYEAVIEVFEDESFVETEGDAPGVPVPGDDDYPHELLPVPAPEPVFTAHLSSDAHVQGPLLFCAPAYSPDHVI